MDVYGKNREKFLDLQGSQKINEMSHEIQEMISVFLPKQESRDMVIKDASNQISNALSVLEIPPTVNGFIANIPFIGNYITGKIKEERKKSFADMKTLLSEVQLTLTKENQSLLQDNIVINDIIKKLENSIETRKKEVESANEELKELESKKEAISIDENGNQIDNEVNKVDIDYEFTLRRKIDNYQNQMLVESNFINVLHTCMMANFELSQNIDTIQSTSFITLQASCLIENQLNKQNDLIKFTNTLVDQSNRMNERLGQQVKEQAEIITQQSIKGVVDREKLINAIKDTNKALDTITTFRETHLPRLVQIMESTNKFIEKFQNPDSDDAASLSQMLANFSSDVDKYKSISFSRK